MQVGRAPGSKGPGTYVESRNLGITFSHHFGSLTVGWRLVRLLSDGRYLVIDPVPEEES